MKYVGLRACRLGAIVLSLGVISCGRSDQIGWTAGERGGQTTDTANVAGADQPGADVARESDPTASGQLPPQMYDTQGLVAEYQRLYESLAPLRARAFQDDEVAAAWEKLLEAADEQILETSEFHRKLIDRREEIIDRMEQAEESAEMVPVAEQMRLAGHLKNIEREMARMRNIEIQQPAFKPLMLQFHALLYEKMRELEPEREAEINRMEQVGQQLILVSEPPPRNPVLPLEIPEAPGSQGDGG